MTESAWISWFEAHGTLSVCELQWVFASTSGFNLNSLVPCKNWVHSAVLPSVGTLPCSLSSSWLPIFIKLLGINTFASLYPPVKFGLNCLQHPKAIGVEGFNSTVQHPDSQNLGMELAEAGILACFKNEAVPMNSVTGLPKSRKMLDFLRY